MKSSKIKAASIHFLLSLVVITFIICLMIYFWFPSSIIEVSNFKEIVLLIISIDLVLGPILTFVVYKENKKGLKLDLTVIAGLQLSALVFGVYNLYQVHPLYITFNVDRFTLVSAMDSNPNEVQIESLRKSKFSSPVLVVSELPEDISEKNNLVLNALENGGSSFELNSKYYKPYSEDYIDKIISKSLDPEIVFKETESRKKLDKFINKYGKNANDYAYLPLEGTAKDAIWVLDLNTGKPIDTISVLPWGKLAKKN